MQSEQNQTRARDPAYCGYDLVVTGIGGNCPVQGYGTVNGKPFYFRARGDSWRMNIGGEDNITDPEWSYGEDYGTGPYDAGWMTEEEARVFIRQSAEKFAAGHPTDGWRMFA